MIVFRPLFSVASVVFFALLSAAVNATPLKDCKDIPKEGQIPAFSRTQTETVCREAIKVLEPLDLAALQLVSYATFVLSYEGYMGRDIKGISAELVEIIRLRGQFDQPKAWTSSINMTLKAWELSHGSITPRNIVQALQNKGTEASRSLSNDDFSSMIALMIAIRKRGG